jgi:phosphopantetheinyl transferase (holo-ACP synthase)
MLSGMPGVAVAMDLVDVADVEESLAAHGVRYVSTLVGPDEEATIGSRTPRSLAMAFAAKECVMKLLEVGDEAVDWRSIELRPRGKRAWDVDLSGAAATLADRRGIASISVSVGATSSVATAVAVAEPSGER